MIFGTKNKEAHEHFSVVNISGALVPGIDVGEFDVDLFNPGGTVVSGSVVSIIELSGGHYRAAFTPDEVGTWYMVIYHSQYFPWGKSDDILVYTSDFDLIASDLARTLGLTQENYYLDQTIYTTYQGIKLLSSGRIRIYSDAVSVGGDTNVIATYQVASTWSNDELTSYKVVKS